MAIIETINSAINTVVWGKPMLVLLVGAGILLTIRTFGVQFRKFGYAMKNTLGKVFTKTEAKEGEMTPFQAMSTALAGTVGTGNIAGITTAITLGGPGTMLWLWITALIGMATKYSEVLLAVRFRERNKDGDWVGMDQTTADRLVWDNRTPILKSVGAYADDMPADLTDRVCVMDERSSAAHVKAPDPWTGVDPDALFQASGPTIPDPDPGIDPNSGNGPMGPGIGM